VITIITNGKRRKAPTCWREVTTDQAQRIARDWDCTDKIKLFNILTGTEYAKVRDSTELGSKFWDVIQFAYFPAEVRNAKMPKVFKLNGKYLSIPKKVGRLSVGQAIAVRQKMEQVQARLESAMKQDPDFKKYCFKDNFFFDELVSFACAVYFQPQYDDAPFDDERAEQLEADILKMPITDVYPVGFFFLNQQLNYGKRSMPVFLQRIARRMPSVRAFLEWLRWKSLPR
jgi:hypothetical protein